MIAKTRAEQGAIKPLTATSRVNEEKYWGKKQAGEKGLKNS